jgi:hypothetical protein
VFLMEFMQERSCWIGAAASELLCIENHLRVEVYCSVQPRSVTVDLDSGLVYRDPRRALPSAGLGRCQPTDVPSSKPTREGAQRLIWRQSLLSSEANNQFDQGGRRTP